MTIKDKIKACDYVINNLLEEQERIIYRNEHKIIALNTSQFDKGEGNDDKVLKNNNDMFKGTYTLSTNLINPDKKAGGLYNFFETGDFLRGLEIEVDNSLTKLSIFSTGTGSGSKKMFFDGYTNLFGLNKENNRILNYDIIMPELNKWILKYL